jgi:hypothetical protein
MVKGNKGFIGEEVGFCFLYYCLLFVENYNEIHVNTLECYTRDDHNLALQHEGAFGTWSFLHLLVVSFLPNSIIIR